MSQRDLFPDLTASFAEGYAYEPDFLSAAEESALLETVRQLPLANAEYKQYRARRRVISYGGRYDYVANQLNAAEAIPAFLQPLRERVAAWAGRHPNELTHALVAEYSAGTPLGWHRDVPDFDLVIGVSLLSACRMRFRRYPPKPGDKPVSIELAPRSIYRLERKARWNWQHSVPPVPALRYSITFRTLVTPLS
jgi:alkylated DNA repair dioxygenase AlkB